MVEVEARTLREAEEVIQEGDHIRCHREEHRTQPGRRARRVTRQEVEGAGPLDQETPFCQAAEVGRRVASEEEDIFPQSRRQSRPTLTAEETRTPTPTVDGRVAWLARTAEWGQRSTGISEHRRPVSAST